MPAIETRLDELLLLRATQRLSEAEQAELDGLLAARGGDASDVYERTAAAVHIGALRARARMPSALRARIEQQALRFLQARARTDPEENPGGR